MPTIFVPIPIRYCDVPVPAIMMRPIGLGTAHLFGCQRAPAMFSYEAVEALALSILGSFVVLVFGSLVFLPN